MATLGVDTTSRDWFVVRLYIEERIAEMRDECCAVGTDPARRQGLAERIDELKDMLEAPAAAKAASQQRAMTMSVDGSVY